MSKPFDAHTYHINQSNISSYAVSPNLVQSTTWQHTSTGLEVVNDDEESFIATIVGCALAYHLRCGPAGNHFSSGMTLLEKAKYQFHICHPANHELGADFTAAINNLEALQNQVGKTKDHKNMIINDVTGKMLCCATNVFATWIEIVPDSRHGQKVENAPKIDEGTKNWPIPDNFVKEFDILKYKFKAHPLPLYHDNHLIQPVHANEILNGAMVEVQFQIHHWCIKDFDSFQATPQKVTILKLGPIHIPSNYKRPIENKDAGQIESKRARCENEASTS
ncbi:hypothetical protein BDR03DRAFT_1018094 [Suillus americanus]|nr:hypothetical protein BDR03DRAFT_1018094 [Suillus americanus]